jgi:hypothetical protein
MQPSLEIRRLPELSNWQGSERVMQDLASRFQTMTKLQFNLMTVLGRDRHSVFIENQVKNGKSTAIVFYMLHKLLVQKSSSVKREIVPLHVLLFPNSSFVEKFSRKLETYQALLKELNCEIVYENEKRNKYLESPQIRFCVATTQDCIKMLREERLSVNEINGLLIDDLDYLVSFGQVNNLSRLISYLKAKSPKFFHDKDLIIFTNEERGDEMAKIRAEVAVPFVNLRIRKEAKKDEGLDEENDGDEVDDAAANLAKAIFNQFFFINSEINGYALLYLICKFDVFPQGTMIVTSSISEAYKILMFIERSHLGVAKIYNPSHPATLKAYNISLFNSGQAKILVTTHEYVQDFEKQKEKISPIKGLRNLIFMKSEINFQAYSSFLEVLQGNQNYYVPGTSFDFNILYIVPNDTKYGEGEKKENQNEEEGGEEEIQNPFVKKFYELIAEQEVVYNKIMFEPMTVDLKDVEMFNYRMETLFNSLTYKQVKLYRLIEMQKLLLKSKKMKEYFSSHANEKELVLVKLNRLSKQLKKYAVSLPKDVPEYLIPNFVKEEATERNRKIREKRANSIKNNQKLQDPKNVRKVFATENPVLNDPKQLKTFSSHKLWKIRHHKIKKFQNKKKLAKGIYNI